MKTSDSNVIFYRNVIEGLLYAWTNLCDLDVVLFMDAIMICNLNIYKNSIKNNLTIHWVCEYTVTKIDCITDKYCHIAFCSSHLFNLFFTKTLSGLYSIYALCILYVMYVCMNNIFMNCKENWNIKLNFNSTDPHIWSALKRLFV